MCVIVKVPKHYRKSEGMAKWIGPFNSFAAAEQWAKETFSDYYEHVFVYVNVFEP